MSRMSKTAKVFNYLSSGKPLTASKAFSRFGVSNLRTIIFRLRNEGYTIETVIRSARNNREKNYELVG